MPNCAAPVQVQRAIVELRREMGRLGESERRWFCRWDRSWHVIVPLAGQMSLKACLPDARPSLRSFAPQGQRPQTRHHRPAPAPPAPESYLAAACAYCGAALQVPAGKDEIGRATWGQAGMNYTVQACYRCGKQNAVYPTAGRRGATARAMDQGQPALQFKLKV